MWRAHFPDLPSPTRSYWIWVHNLSYFGPDPWILYIPGTPNNQFKMDVWWNNRFLCNNLESSCWNKCPLFWLEKTFFSRQNKGQMGSRYIYIYTWVFVSWMDFFHHFSPRSSGLMSNLPRVLLELWAPAWWRRRLMATRPPWKSTKNGGYIP